MNSREKGSLFGKTIGGTRIVPVAFKIILVFALFILVSNLTSNYVNLVFNRTKMVNMMRQLLAKDLKDIYVFCNNQFEIYNYNKDLKGSLSSIENRAQNEFTKRKSVLLGVKSDGAILFQASRFAKSEFFGDSKTLTAFNEGLAKNTGEGIIEFRFNNETYFGIYKHNPKWEVFIIRAEEQSEFYEESRAVFRDVSIIILVITIICGIVGVYVLRHVLRFISIITTEIMTMLEEQQLRIINLKGAPNDDITFLGVAFNSLASTISNLLNIFRKFANRDVVIKAYRDREVRLEGKQSDLTILFSDIKSFTFITETLGADIIKLLNLHYDQAIRRVVEHDGIIGSIIGDALLAVFGALDQYEGDHKNKSYQAVVVAYKLQDLTKKLRAEMTAKKKEIEKNKGLLNEDQERVYQAVLLEIGVGIDGGLVFYGNIGSHIRMTNTVIGDNVNAASRLEGLTREYRLPVICSEYVKEDLEENGHVNDIHFFEIDVVKVKGKTEGKKIYWPVLEKDYTKTLEKSMKSFSSGLELYYRGDWRKANLLFKRCALPVGEVFAERTADSTPPRNWNGIWEMKTK
ncbi:MAG: adenylate/guanylate cyclase domain-containing protein [Spirochaetes bacterium]|jgi:class 3 adenylate cyclase|nr:adenylate/guanylate cyclase domain-containing protein [Spirochaetota bacterium]